MSDTNTPAPAQTAQPVRGPLPAPSKPAPIPPSVAEIISAVSPEDQLLRRILEQQDIKVSPFPSRDEIDKMADDCKPVDHAPAGLNYDKYHYSWAPLDDHAKMARRHFKMVDRSTHSKGALEGCRVADNAFTARGVIQNGGLFLFFRPKEIYRMEHEANIRSLIPRKIDGVNVRADKNTTKGLQKAFDADSARNNGD